MRKLILLLILSGCGYNNTKLPTDAAPSQGSGGTNGPEAVLDFATVKAQVFQNNCIRCHSLAGGNKAGVNLENYSSVKPLAQSILSAVNSGFMPPSGTLPSAAKTLLTNWVQAGALEFGAGSSGGGQNPTPTPAPTPVPCEDHQRMINEGQIADLDENFYFDFQSETLQPRHDDCDDDPKDDDKNDNNPKDDNNTKTNEGI